MPAVTTLQSIHLDSHAADLSSTIGSAGRLPRRYVDTPQLSIVPPVHDYGVDSRERLIRIVADDGEETVLEVRRNGDIRAAL